MRLQNFTILFVVIALPVIIILSVFIKYQVDTANLRAEYDNIFFRATYDMLSTFQLNTTNNKYSTVSDTLTRDIEASINIFSETFGNSLGIMGASKNDVMSYVPAVLFTLYDGYYIYTPSANTDGSYEHKLKPYIYYTKEYESMDDKKKIVINYSLDNYVAVYYYNKSENSYESKAGYLEIIANSKNDNGIFVSENGQDLYYNGKKINKNETVYRNKYAYNSNQNKYELIQEQITSQDAYNYYLDAYKFTKWYNDIINNSNLGNSSRGISYKEVLLINQNNNPLPNYDSEFNSEKGEAIQNSIKNNLIQSMETYKRKSDIDFSMPQFNAIDWEHIYKNVCVITFIQGFPLGTSIYNNYVILPSTENKQIVSETNLYYIGYGGDADNSYHRLGCEHLKGDTIIRI